MRTTNRLVAGTLAAVLIFCAAGAARGATPERWLHLKVDSGHGHEETVRINLPLSLAEKVIPTVQADQLRSGRITIGNTSINGVDLRELVAALRQASDTEFVSVEDHDNTVHISKRDGNLLIKVIEKPRSNGRHDGGQNVDIKVPFPVVEALLSGPKNQLDLMAGLRALETYGDATLVTVNDEQDNVRIWVDTRSSSD
ncbi:MAG TPA: hypothetical protein VGW33_05805 [Terriglobia bacterium]|nr:hypothetical protein [Terriglobia bacterium]